MKKILFPFIVLGWVIKLTGILGVVLIALSVVILALPFLLFSYLIGELD